MQVNASAYIVDIGRTEPARETGGSSAAAPAGKATGATGSTDRVELSGTRPDLEKLKRDLAALPDVRLDRVALARQKLQGDGYQVDGRALAQKMMESLGQQ
jgi:negative regulator of flagellin synthesis FlgM